jgi:hypothetical protein
MPMSARRLIALLFASTVVFISAAGAKDFDPGDLRVCNASRCLPIRNRDVLSMLSAFYYGEAQPPIARSPRTSAPMFELRFRNGYVTGIVATRRVDRFLSYGVHLGHFRRGTWYRLPAEASLELRRLSATLKPLRVTSAALEKSV